ncbi:CBM35 domain-containing protein [Streptomyces sp. NPDC048604]|uniref:CBM35 domain-containing protein n=1 Tax=Streptomyces sp. NPDC048604 TaxID=3365578 RepID=UPI003721DFD0
MAAGTSGANTPEDDDPFGYLYEDGQASGAQPPRSGGYGYPGPAAQPGVPRTSYNQVRTVGERQYGGHGQVPQQQPYGQPSAQYAAPETYPGGERTRQAPIPPQRGGGGAGGRGPNTNGLLIGAIAVVAVVVIGITVAIVTNGDENDDPSAGGTPSTGPTAVQESPTGEPNGQETPQQLPQQDAATLKLGGTAALAKDIKGAEGADGAYVTGFNALGSSVTWQAEVEKGGKYFLSVRYAIPAKDANATLSVNDKPNSNPIGLKNFIHSSDPNWEKNWQTTWAPVTLKKGMNTIKISCEQGNQCDAIFDWLKITKEKP